VKHFVAIPISLVLLLVFLHPAIAAAADQPIVRIEASPKHIVVGQPARLRVTILSPTWFPKPPEFPSFELPNAVVRLPPNSAYSTGERRGRTNWSGLVREYVFQPLQPGLFRIEGERVRVTYADPEGFKPRTIELAIPPVELSAFVPEGAEDLDPFLSGSALEITVEVEAGAAGSEDGGAPNLESLAVGGAIKRIVTARIDGMAAMFLPPLAHDAPQSGLSSYPEAALLRDDGTTGERRESTTYVFERAGRYTLAPIRLAYWNTTTRQIEVAEAPGVEVSVRGGVVGVPDTERGGLVRLLPAAGLLLIALLALFFLRKLPARVLSRVRAARARRRASEPVAWRRLIAALRRGDCAESVRSYVLWEAHPALPRTSPQSLEAALRRQREARRDALRSRSRALLPPLNPTSGARVDGFRER
jgi:hypothetical protein